ncbi:MAG: hypothetical protein GF363_00475 [Chitinivibrionales bacterium]|nr:hypothetical protein [Chitinivibrionales bacterium]
MLEAPVAPELNSSTSGSPTCNPIIAKVAWYSSVRRGEDSKAMTAEEYAGPSWTAARSNAHAGSAKELHLDGVSERLPGPAQALRLDTEGLSLRVKIRLT